VDVLVGPPFAVSTDPGRGALAAATETIRAGLAGMVVELDQVRSTT
jgi:1-acyl-sn-glycerol-3-phosphate acyltransferase